MHVTKTCPKAKLQVSEIIRDGEAGRRGARWHKVTFTLTLLFIAIII